MSQSNPSPVKPDLGQYTRNLSFVAIGGEIGCLTVIIIIFALALGIWLDRVLDTKPLFTLFLVLGSAPLALALTVWVAMRSVKNMAKPSSATLGAQQTKEENHIE